MKAAMDGGQGFGEVSLFGESEGDPRQTENFGAEVSVERDQGADSNQRSSCGADCEPRHIGQRTLAERGVGQHSYDYPLDERIDRGADQQGRKERKRSVASRIFSLAHGRQRGFESAVGEDQKQHGSQPLARAGG
jgi:hypothetical protein